MASDASLPIRCRREKPLTSNDF